jgi:tungstate transport system substrate-binding protein
MYLGEAARHVASATVTHAPDAERKFVAEGFSLDRRPVMQNDFVLVGPPDDPAGIKGSNSAAEALAAIARWGKSFVSRGDESGTHMKERQLWKEARTAPAGDWYAEVGSGMGHTLRVANEQRAYTLSDRGTFLAQRGALELTVLVEGDPLLVNQYSVMPVNPQKHPHVRHAAATAFADFLLTPEAQQAIAAFGVEQYGEPLFFPRATPPVRPATD